MRRFGDFSIEDSVGFKYRSHAAINLNFLMNQNLEEK